MEPASSAITKVRTKKETRTASPVRATAHHRRKVRLHRNHSVGGSTRIHGERYCAHPKQGRVDQEDAGGDPTADAPKVAVAIGVVPFSIASTYSHLLGTVVRALHTGRRDTVRAAPLDFHRCPGTGRNGSPAPRVARKARKIAGGGGIRRNESCQSHLPLWQSGRHPILPRSETAKGSSVLTCRGGFGWT